MDSPHSPAPGIEYESTERDQHWSREDADQAERHSEQTADRSGQKPLRSTPARPSQSQFERALMRLSDGAGIIGDRSDFGGAYEPMSSPMPGGENGEDGSSTVLVPSDRRAFPRRESGCMVSLLRHRGDTPLNPQEITWHLHASAKKGHLVDVSMSGVAFLLTEPVEKDEHVYLRLSNTRRNKCVDKTATVLRAISSGHGEWKIVCKFDHNLTFEQVHELGRSLFQSPYV